MSGNRLSKLGVLLLGSAAATLTIAAPATAKGPVVIRAAGGATVSVYASGLNNPRGLKFGPDGNLYARMYALEMTATAGFPAPGAGAIVRISQGKKDTIVSGLDFPTGMTFGPDGALYVSANGLGPNGVGGGQVLRVRLPD